MVIGFARTYGGGRGTPVWFSRFSRFFGVMAERPAPVRTDPLVAALARYLEALDRRYPDGPDQMRRERLAAAANRANVVPMNAKREAGAA